MMETNFQRRTPGKLVGIVGPPKGSLSPKGTIKKKKQDRKTKERHAQEICNLNIQIGRLEDRDTQQQAFATLIESLPGLDASLVKEVYAMIEKNKKPGRSSTRRMLVLLVAALCRCHPVPSAKLLPRILSYACLRLRDRHAKTTDACVILVSAVALYVLPCPTINLPGDQTCTTQQPFEAVAAVFAKESNVVGEAATKCLCGMLRPVDFDGVSVPGPTTILTHATRIRLFFKTLVASTVEKMDGSTMFASFSSLFLLLQTACQLARDANEKASFTELGDDFAPYIISIYETIEDAFQCGTRENWMLRKRGMELLTLLLDIFALQETAWCTTVNVAKDFFQAQLERVRALVLAGRHDSISLVRKAAIPAAVAFDFLETLCPQSDSGLQSSASANYDFVPPDPLGYSFTGKRWAKPAVSRNQAAHITTANVTKEVSPISPSESTDAISAQIFGDEATGDEVLPSLDDFNDEDSLTSLHSVEHKQLVRAPSKNREVMTLSGTAAKVAQDDDKFTDLVMDQATAPENDDDAQPTSEDEKRRDSQSNQEQDKGSTSHKMAVRSSVAEQGAQSLSGVMQSVSNLKQFVAKQRAQTGSRRAQHQDIPKISLPKRRSSEAINTSEDVNHFQPNYYSTELSRNDNNNAASNLELTRTEAVLQAAQCGEYELAFRLCIVEDDLELLRRTMSMIKSPCMATLSTMARNALCTAFLSLLDSDEDGDSSDVWLVLQWLERWAADIRNDREQLEQLDPRVAQALNTKLHDMTRTPTNSSLVAAHVVFLLGI